MSTVTAGGAPGPGTAAGGLSARFAGLLVLAALVIRLAALWGASEARPVNDEETYFLRARTLLETGEFVGSYQGWVRHPEAPNDAIPQYRGAYQPPGYTAFVAALLWIGGGRVMAVRLAQVLLGALTAGLVYWIARAWVPERTARWAGVLTALYPNLVAFSHYVFSETLFIFLVLAGFGLLLSRSTPSLGRFLASGVVLALAALTRSPLLYFLPFFGAWLLWVHRRDRATVLRRGALSAGVLLALLAPWVARNCLLHGGFVLIDTNGPYNAWKGNAEGAYRERPDRPGRSYAAPFEAIPLDPVLGQQAPQLVDEARRMFGTPTPTDLQVIACANRLVRERLREDPRGFLRRAGYKLVDMWNPTSFLLRHFQLGAYGPVLPALEATVTWLAVAAYVVAMLLALLGLLRLRANPLSGLVLLQVGYYTGIHLASFGLTRFRLPLMPWILILSAQGCCSLLAPRKRRQQADPTSPAA